MFFRKMEKRSCRILLGGLALAFGLLTGCGAAGEAKEASTEDQRSGVGYFADEMSKAAAENSAKKLQEIEEARSEGEGDTVKIRSVDDLISFRDRVNGGEPAVDAVLEADLDLSSVCGQSLGNWEPIQKYNGTFEGNGHTISGLYFSGSEEDKAGLFASTDVNSVIQNLSMENVLIDGAGYAGAVVGRAEGSIIGCQSSGQIRGTGRAAGGIAGQMDGGLCQAEGGAVIADCTNYAEISHTNTGKSIAGGVVGYLIDTNASNCRNEGKVSGVAATMGGVFGALESGKSEPVEIADCINVADVDGLIYVGGFCGDAEFCIMNRCKNTGNVTGTVYVGGLCGYFGGGKTSAKKFVALMVNCSNEGDASLNYLQKGEYLKPGNAIYDIQQLGGLSGILEAGVVLNCRNAGDLTCSTGKNYLECGAGYLAIGKRQGDRSLLFNSVSTGTITPPENSEHFENSRLVTGRGDGADDSALIFFLGEEVAEEIEPTEESAFADGTVLAALNGFPEGVSEALMKRLSDTGFEYELSGWKSGTDGFPVLEWE